MPIVVEGAGLSIADVVAVARGSETVALSGGAVERMTAARRSFEEAIAAGAAVYGSSTGVGTRQGESAEVAGRSNRVLLATHRVALGPPAPGDVVRATALVLANQLATGRSPARAQLPERLLEALAEDRLPAVRTLGSVGEADLGPLTDLALGLFDPDELEAGEGLVLIGTNAFATAWAALALADAERLLDAIDVAASCSFEGFGGNVRHLHPAVGDAMPHPGVRRTLERLRRILEGSALWEPDAARNLQDPMSFRSVPQVHGAARDAVRAAIATVEVELNGYPGNPLVVPGEPPVPAANFDALALSASLDATRIVLASVLQSSIERTAKLVDEPWSGLPAGLASSPEPNDSGYSILAIAAAALGAEARLLAAPASLGMPTSTLAVGKEDRGSLAPVSARTLAEQVALGERICAIELAVAARAIELRGSPRLGSGSGAARRAVAEAFPAGGGPDLPDVEAIAALIRSGALSDLGAG